jgi:hypothetical protein
LSQTCRTSAINNIKLSLKREVKNAYNSKWLQRNVYVIKIFWDVTLCRLVSDCRRLIVTGRNMPGH